jgi:hypothetical protein
MSNFIALGQSSRLWSGMTASPNGDIYAAVSGGSIYKQSEGIGDFIDLNQTHRGWFSMAAAPNGDVYASDSTATGNLYIQEGGVGDFVTLNQTARYWSAVAAAPNGDVYAAVNNGSIYKRIAGAENFIDLVQAHRLWFGMTVAPNGDVYASVAVNGDIYKQTDGTFIALNQTLRSWRNMAAAPNGNIYAAAGPGSTNIYMQTDGTGNFISLTQASLFWNGMAAAPNGNIYAAVGSGDIYEQTNAPPSIFLQPVSVTKTLRDIATFSVISSGTSYQWYFNGSALTDDGRISGSTTTTLTINNTLVTDAGDYVVVTSNGIAPDATSTGAVLTIIPESFGNGQGSRATSSVSQISSNGETYLAGQLFDYN